MPSLSFLLRICGRTKSKTSSTPIPTEKSEYTRPVTKPITVGSSRIKSQWPLDDSNTRTPRVVERPTEMPDSTETLDLKLEKTRSISTKSISTRPTSTRSMSLTTLEKTITAAETPRKPVVQTPIVPAKEILHQISATPLTDAEISAQFIQHQLEFQQFVQEAYVEDCNTKEAEEIIRSIRQFGRHEAFQDLNFPQLLLETWLWMRMKVAFEKGELLPECYSEGKRRVLEGDRPDELRTWRALEITRLAPSASLQEHLDEQIESICTSLESLTSKLMTQSHLPKRKLIAHQSAISTKLRSLVKSIAITLIQWEAQEEGFRFIYPTSAGWLEPGKIENIAKRGAQRDSVMDADEEQGRFSGGIVVPMLVKQGVENGTLVPAWARIQFLTAAEKRWSGTMDQFVSNRNYETSSGW